MKFILLMGFAAFAFGLEVDPPKDFECVGWLISAQTLYLDHIQDFGEKLIKSEKDLQALGLDPLVDKTDYHYYSKLAEQHNLNKWIYYFEGDNALEFVYTYLQNAIQSSWGLGVIQEQDQATLRTRRHLKAKLDATQKERAVQLGSKFNLDLFSKDVARRISNYCEKSWAKTVRVRNIRQNEIEGDLTVTYGQKNHMPFILLAAEFKS